jgi:hypothetical protein
MPVRHDKRQILVVMSKELEESLRAFLTDASKGYVPRGAQSNFICEAIQEKLAKSANLNVNEFFGEEE